MQLEKKIRCAEYAKASLADDHVRPDWLLGTVRCSANKRQAV